jgi:hypothetical protein
MMIPARRPDYYYACQPLLTWVLSHYFFGAQHYVWVAAPFHPFLKKNPRSSNPWQLFGARYEAWCKADYFDQYVTTSRSNLRNALSHASISRRTAGRLARCCHRVELAFFIPLIYRVDVSTLAPRRLDRSRGSAALGSDEYLISDLREHEFDLLFYEECFDDSDLIALLSGSLHERDVLRTLESRLHVPAAP